MKTIFFTLYCLAIALQLQAQFIQTESGQFEGQNIHQTDIDSLFISNPGLTWLEIHYVDSTLQLPALKALSIFSLHSATLRELTFTDSLPKLQLIDFNIPSLTSITEPVAPNLFQITLYASLDSLPNFICTAPELSLVDIKNYKDIMWPDCMEERFVNGPFELSSCEILDAKDGNTISKIVSPDKVEGEVDLSVEDYVELQKSMKKSARRIGIIRRTSGFLLAGVVFLIWAS